jgi:hypothetical protein
MYRIKTAVHVTASVSCSHKNDTQGQCRGWSSIDMTEDLPELSAHLTCKCTSAVAEDCARYPYWGPHCIWGASTHWHNDLLADADRRRGPACSWGARSGPRKWAPSSPSGSAAASSSIG